MSTKLNITHIASGTSVLGGRKAVLYAPKTASGIQGWGAKAGILPQTDTAAPGSLEPLARYIDQLGLEIDFGYENGHFCLRIGGFENDAHLRKILTEDFPEWYAKQPESQDNEIIISKKTPILALDNEPEEKKAFNLRAWIYKNSSFLTGVVGTISGLLHFLKGSMEGMGKEPPFKVTETGTTDKQSRGGKHYTVTSKKYDWPDSEQLKKFFKSMDRKQYGSLLFIAAAAFLAILSKRSQKNRSIDEILNDVEKRLQVNNPEAALTPPERNAVQKTMDWMVKNPWRVNATLNALGNAIHITQNVGNHSKANTLKKLREQDRSNEDISKIIGVDAKPLDTAISELSYREDREEAEKFIEEKTHDYRTLDGHRTYKTLDHKHREKALEKGIDVFNHVKKLEPFEILATGASLSGLSLILFTPQQRSSGFPGLNDYANEFKDTLVNKESGQTVKSVYDAVDAYPSNDSQDSMRKGKSDFIDTLQRKHMDWNAKLSLGSNFGYLITSLVGDGKVMKDIGNFITGGGKGRKASWNDALDNMSETIRNKGGAFYIAMFFTNTIADLLTGISVASFSHSPESVYNDVAKWIDKRFDKDTDPQLLEQFSYQLAFYLASTKEISMNSDQIARGVITRLGVKHGRPVNYDRKIAQEYLQLQILSPFTKNTEKIEPLVNQFRKDDRLEVETRSIALKDHRKTPAQKLAEQERATSHGGRLTESRQTLAESPGLNP